jgi:hypothetical protein
MADDQSLAAAVDELADTLEDLRVQLREPPRGPLGVPRPPTPRELLRLTEGYTIPALVAFLETNVRMLELLAAALRVADGRPLDAVDEPGVLEAGSRTLEAAGRDGADGLAAASRATLARLDDALVELQAAAEGDAPDDPEVHRLLSEARELRAEVDERLSEATTVQASGSHPMSGSAGEEPEATAAGDEGVDGPVGVDVEEELDTLRRRADRPTDPDEGDDADSGGS